MAAFGKMRVCEDAIVATGKMQDINEGLKLWAGEKDRVSSVIGVGLATVN